MAVAAGPLDSFGKHPALGSRPAVTVDQPPLAVGVRFPLCPPTSFNDDGPIGPVARFLCRDEEGG